MTPNKRFEFSDLYFITGVGWGKFPAVCVDVGRIGYKGEGEEIVPYEVMEKFRKARWKVDLVKLLIECIKYDQEVEFEEVPNVNCKELFDWLNSNEKSLTDN